MDRPLHTHVIGVSCGAGRAMNPLCLTRLDEVTYTAVNTDRAALSACLAPRTILLESDGRDAGGSAERGRLAAMEAYAQLVAAVQGADVVVIIAGLGGGTGSGAVPLLAEIAKDHGCLTVAVVTLPFYCEGSQRCDAAEKSRWELQPRVDTLLTISLERLWRVMGKQVSLGAAFHFCDEVVSHTVRSVLWAITQAEFRALFAGMGQVSVGMGVAYGEHRGVRAAWRAVTSPLLEAAALAEARTVLLSLTGGPDLTLRDVNDAMNVVSGMTRAEVCLTQAEAPHPHGDLWVTVLAARSPLGG